MNELPPDNYPDNISELPSCLDRLRNKALKLVDGGLNAEQLRADIESSYDTACQIAAAYGNTDKAAEKFQDSLRKLFLFMGVDEFNPELARNLNPHATGKVIALSGYRRSSNSKDT